MARASGLVLISGPTGTGKSELAVALALRVDGEIINADSIQIYRGFDIGSAKPDRTSRERVPHHLFDRLDPDEHLDVARWVAMATETITEIRARRRVPIIVGGTNFYLRALLRGLPEMPARQPELRSRLGAILDQAEGARHLHRLLRAIDPVSGARIERADRHRIMRAIEVFAASGRPVSSFEAPSADAPPLYPHVQFALSLDRPTLRKRLDSRVERMYEAGLIEEVRGLLSRYSPELRPFSSIGYREAVACVQGKLDRETAIEETRRRTWAYARRQMSWLHAERDVQWLDASEPLDRIIPRMLERLATRIRRSDTTDL